MKQMKAHFSRMIFTCTALLILNAVVPQRLYILPACCSAHDSSCCNKATSTTNPIIFNPSCCEVVVIELRQALSTQVIAQRNCPEFFSIEICNSAHTEHLIGYVQTNKRPMNAKDKIFNLRSNKTYPEPRIQI
jgi:hypothetical protein